MQVIAKILLIEDQKTYRNLLRHILTRANYQVIEAEDGEEGIALFKERSPSLILVDALLPKLSGFECCQAIRELPKGKETPIMMVTSLKDNDSINKAFQIGVSDFVIKPIHPQMLLGRIRYMLQLADAIQSLRDSKERYQSLVSSLQEILFQLTPEGYITFVNPTWHKIMGYQLEETIGEHFLDFLHPEEKKCNHIKLQKALENNKIKTYKTRFLTKENEIRWVNMQISGKNQGKKGITGRLYDITEEFHHEKYRRLESIIYKIISRSDSIDLTIKRILQAISGSLEFPLAEFWSLDPKQQELKKTVYWHSKNYQIKKIANTPNSFYLEDWMESIYDITAHISDLKSEQEIVTRQKAGESPQIVSFKCVQHCLITNNQQTLGLIVFWHTKKQKKNDSLSRDLEILGQQIGQYLKQKQAEKALKQKNELLQCELNQAARYVESLLPCQTKFQFKKHTLIQIETFFKPSNALGGDVFDYAWLDSQHLMFYVLDVAGHGIKSALLSVSILNILRQQNYTKMDLYEPAIVLDTLNQLFKMSESGEDYFTVWYGVFNTESNILKYASAGHPEAVLLTPNKETMDYEIQCLNSDNIAVGLFPDFPFVSNSIELTKKSRLFIFSDGVYEFFVDNNEKIFGLKNWCQLILDYAQLHQFPKLQFLFEQINDLNYDPELEDDCSIMEIIFH